MSIKLVIGGERLDTVSITIKLADKLFYSLYDAET